MIIVVVDKCRGGALGTHPRWWPRWYVSYNRRHQSMRRLHILYLWVSTCCRHPRLLASMSFFFAASLMQFLHFLACCRHQLLMSGIALNPLQDRVKHHPLPCKHRKQRTPQGNFKSCIRKKKIWICFFLQCIIVNWIFWGFGILVWQNMHNAKKNCVANSLNSFRNMTLKIEQK